MNTKTPAATRLFYWLMALTAVIVLAGALVISNNSIRSAPIFAGILVFGVAVMAGLGMRRAALAVLALVAAWISVKEAIGVWHEATFLFNLSELAAAGLAFVLAGFFHDRLRSIEDRLESSELAVQQLDLVDASVGLIKPTIGMLRLEEEEQRAVRFRRPFSLVLVLVLPQPGVDWDPAEGTEFLRTVASMIKDTTRRMDIPFLAGSYRIAVILPETEVAGANQVCQNIQQRLLSARNITAAGESRELSERAQVRYGLATFRGASRDPIHMMPAAEDSLQNSMDASSLRGVQDLIVGEEPAAPTAGSPSAPADRTQPVDPDAYARRLAPPFGTKTERGGRRKGGG